MITFCIGFIAGVVADYFLNAAALKFIKKEETAVKQAVAKTAKKVKAKL